MDISIGAGGNMETACTRSNEPGWPERAASVAALAAVVLAALAPARAAPATLPAFPGAEGGGALAKGGRGGAVLEVTNLNDSGPGSLRACVAARGPRTCVFRVGGTILLRSSLVVLNPYLTVAGQTAPGGGIQLVGPFSTGDPAAPDNTGNWSSLYVRTHDVVIRYLRIRHGLVRDDLCAGPCQWGRCRAGDRQGGACRVGGKPDAITVAPTGGPDGFATDIVVDHVSLQWAPGRAFAAWNNVGVKRLRNVSFQWSLAAESLKGHSTALLVGSDNPGFTRTRDLSNSITDFDWHHNLTMSADYRHPLIKAKTSRFVNNLVYNWALYATQIGGGAAVDVISNVYKAGPMHAGRREVSVYPWTANPTVASGDPSIHLAGNVGPNHADPSADGWARMVAWIPHEGGPERPGGANVPDAARIRRAEPLASPPVPITTTAAGPGLERLVLAEVGASRRLDCDGRLVDARDALDRRLVEEVRRGAGPRDAGDRCRGDRCLPQGETTAPEHGFPVLAAGIPCPDGDRDGMPDGWELARGLDPRDGTDGRRIRRDGYSNLEHYLNGSPAPDVRSSRAQLP